MNSKKKYKMKTRYFIIVLAFFAVNALKAQQTVQRIPVFEEESAEKSKLTKGNFYLESLNNIGGATSSEVEKIINNTFAAKGEEENSGNVRWFYDRWLKSIPNKEEAASYIKIDYSYANGAEVKEILLKEKSGNPRLPYFLTTKINFVDIQVILTINYADGSPTAYDTINIYKESKLIPGKKYKSVETLNEWGLQQLKWRIDDQINFVNPEEVQFVFPKVKIKDKALKAKYKEVKVYLKNGDYQKAGAIVKRVYEAEQKPEQAQALGLCYELIGNYPKAAEMYKISSDFHIKVRMKKNMKMLKFAKSMGYEPQFMDFE